MEKAQYLAAGAVGLALLTTVAVLNTTHNTSSGDKVAGTIVTDNGDLKINWDRYPTYDIELTSSFSITQSGTYHLTGSLTDGLIVVNAPKDAVVRLILDNASIENSNGPAIACYTADDLVIELVGDNHLSDGTKYSTDYDEDVTGAIYSKDDLTFQGDGSLTITANYQDGIVSKDDLKFNGGTYNIKSADDGIRGKDSVYIVNGNFAINSSGDAIKSTNETTAGKGFILVEQGTFALTSTDKALKAVNSILIYGGTFHINSTDDAIHSNNYIGILGGDFTISSGDDGIHADKELIIDAGHIDIQKSYEGLEAQAITINGGEISVVASDDGINAGGGADASAMNRPGANNFDSDDQCVLTFNGGTTYVNAAGDGVDSNGYIYFNGGTVTIDGPTSNGDGALDSGISIQQNGGTVIAVGASGMAETLGSSSSIYNASIYFAGTQPAGTTIEIKDAADSTLIRHKSAKSFSHLAVGTPDFKSGNTYTIYLGGTLYESFTISGITTTVGNPSANFNNAMPGGRGGDLPNDMRGDLPDSMPGDMRGGNRR